MDEALSAITVLQHGLTPPLSPHAPSPRVWAADCALVRKVSDGVEDEGLGPWDIKLTCLACQTSLETWCPGPCQPIRRGSKVKP